MIKKLILALGLLALPVMAQLPVKNVDGSNNELQIAAGGKRFESALTAITTGGVTVTAVTTKVQTIFCTEIGNAATTLTVTDNQGSPVTYINAVSMASPSILVIGYGTQGLTFTSGLIISASANTQIKCQVVGVQ